jgi:hypothetical protein
MSDPAPKKTSARFVSIGFALMTVLALLLIVWNRSLVATIARQNAQLEEAVRIANQAQKELATIRANHR